MRVGLESETQGLFRAGKAYLVGLIRLARRESEDDGQYSDLGSVSPLVGDIAR
jgi:hypothetical protein